MILDTSKENSHVAGQARSGWFSPRPSPADHNDGRSTARPWQQLWSWHAGMAVSSPGGKFSRARRASGSFGWVRAQ